jgi:lysophospholipase L1-like esterase
MRRIGAVLSILFCLVALMPAGAVRADVAPLRIMVVGDSISVGCDATPPTSWCGELDALLTDRGIPHAISAHAISGWSCQALADTGFVARFTAVQPNVVIMNCGTNDVPSTPAARDRMGEKWRTMVEYSWTHGAHILPVFVGYSNPEINAKNGRGWLLDGEGAANDTIYSQLGYYQPAGWFVGLADLQRVPGDWNYLKGGTDGIHPNGFGNQVYGRIFYRSMRAYYGWPDDVAEPCGLWGHRVIYNPPAYTPCTLMG